ncbi:MAG: chemotaxis protein CheW [Deltaproteobacteria bacterium]|nr:chemotaxis protein CheW [Deltaproteobacteria bacterium]
MSEGSEHTTNQYLTFALDKEIYALATDTVKEVLQMTTITRIPRTPEFMRGVMNLRGHAVPVVDLRLKFGMKTIEDTVNTCIIIVDVMYDDEATQMGAVVDSVREVFEMDAAQIEAPPKMGTTIDSSFIRGMGRQEDDFIIILDIDKIFSLEELAAVVGQAGGAETSEA